MNTYDILSLEKLVDGNFEWNSVKVRHCGVYSWSLAVDI